MPKPKIEVIKDGRLVIKDVPSFFRQLRIKPCRWFYATTLNGEQLASLPGAMLAAKKGFAAACEYCGDDNDDYAFEPGDDPIPALFGVSKPYSTGLDDGWFAFKPVPLGDDEDKQGDDEYKIGYYDGLAARYLMEGLNAFDLPSSSSNSVKKKGALAG